jgi:parallel beta-helix repeat protein
MIACMRFAPGLAIFTLSMVSVEAALAAEVKVATTTELAAAIAAAKGGDTIVLADGTYAVKGKLSCAANGTAASPIVVRAASRRMAKIEVDTIEAFAVTGAHWRFEGLDVVGVCANDSACEHAFHVTGAAVGFVLRDSAVRDFNAQLKVNATQIGGTWTMPHQGLVEGNDLFDSRARNTGNPVTKLNIDTGDDWIVRANVIRDFQKGAGNNISYGAFMKSGGKRGLFERNLVLCARDTTGGTRIGLSFGGGGTAPQFCAPAFDASTPCDVEHENGVMRNNVIANCSDVGIYLNRSKDTAILHNTLIGTTGIDFRFGTTTGEARGNVLSSKIRVRDGGTFTGVDNLMDVPAAEFAAMYHAPLEGDLRKKGDLAKLIDKATAAKVGDDYCARARSGTHDLGALEHSLGDCATTTPTPGGDAGSDGGAPSDAGAPSDGGGTPAPIDGSTPGDGGGDGGGSEGLPRADDAGCACRVPATRTSTSTAAHIALVGATWVTAARLRRRVRRSHGRARGL